MSADINSNPNHRSLGRCICIITGASKGFGRTLAHQVYNFLNPGSVLLLVARSGTLLQELKKELQSFTDEQQLVVRCIAVDLSTTDGVNKTVRVAKEEAISELDHVLLINNAASLGDISQFTSFTDPEEVNSFLFLNVSSALSLTAGILQAFPCRAGLRWTVVNVSSVFAEQPLPSWVLYCTAKAARKMMFSVLAEEEPNVKVLSYSPGLQTDFLEDETENTDSTGLLIEVCKCFEKRKEAGPMDTEMQQDIRRLTGIKYHLFPCHESAAKLMKLLLDNDFATGAHLDFFTV